MLKQNIKGVVRNVNANGSEEDVTALIKLMAGEITEYELKASGGSELRELPETLNKKVYIVGSKATSTNGRISTMISIPHVNPSRVFHLISADIINKFNADYETAVKADYVNLKFDK